MISNLEVVRELARLRLIHLQNVLDKLHREGDERDD